MLRATERVPSLLAPSQRRNPQASSLRLPPETAARASLPSRRRRAAPGGAAGARSPARRRRSPRGGRSTLTMGWKATLADQEAHRVGPAEHLGDAVDVQALGPAGHPLHGPHHLGVVEGGAVPVPIVEAAPEGVGGGDHRVPGAVPAPGDEADALPLAPRLAVEGLRAWSSSSTVAGARSGLSPAWRRVALFQKKGKLGSTWRGRCQTWPW